MNILSGVRCASLIAVLTAAGGLAIQPALAWNGKGCGVRYSITDLGTLGGSYARALNVNNRSHVTGYSYTSAGQTHAFLWTRQDGMEDLGTLPGGVRSFGYGINDRDQVVGVSVTAAGKEHVFLWSRQQGMRDLSSVSGKPPDINNHGQVSGPAGVWSPGFGWQSLGTLGGSVVWPFGINHAGQVVGEGNTATGVFHAFLWTRAGGIRDLGTPSGYDSSGARKINNRGAIAGEGNITNGGTRAILWTKARGWEELDSVGSDYIASDAEDINNLGQVVGSRLDSNYNPSVFTWSRKCGTQTLNVTNPSFSFSDPRINDRGQISGGYCVYEPDFFCGAALLTAVHE